MSNILFSEIAGFKLYNLSKGRTLKELLDSVNNNSKKLKKNTEYMNRIELIQEFDWNVAGNCMKLSEDGSHMFAAGVYKPRLKIYDLNEMALKVERGVDSEVRRICPISNDFTKCALLLEDRTIEVHAQYGKHFTVRIPKFGRDMIYNKHSSEIITCGTGNDVYRLNLCNGSFMKPLNTDIEGINACKYNDQLNVLGLCGNGGKIEIWDLRSFSKSACIPIFPVLEDSYVNTFGSDASNRRGLYNSFYDPTENTSLDFNGANNLAVSNKNGTTYLFDLRYPKPVYNIKHSYKLPIHSTRFHDSSNTLITVDKKQIKISDFKTGKVISNVEANSDINDFELYQGSGMFFTANDNPKMDIYFAPSLGPAPKWCSFLEKITEECEETNTSTITEDKKFLDVKNLEELSCTNLIGTKFLTPYMHGYFMDIKMYKKLKQMSEPFSYEKYVEDKKQEKLNKLLENRIIITDKKKLKEIKKRNNDVDFYNQSDNEDEGDNKGEIDLSKVKVNAELLKDAFNDGTEDNNDKLVADNRFSSKLFTNEDFKIDYTSNAYKQAKFKEKKNFKNTVTNDNTKENKYFRSALENDNENNFNNNLELDEVESGNNNKIVGNKLLDLKEKLQMKKLQNKRMISSHTNDDQEVEYNKKIKNFISEDVQTIEAKIKSQKRKIDKKEIKTSRIEKVEANKEGRRLLFSGKSKFVRK